MLGSLRFRTELAIKVADIRYFKVASGYHRRHIHIKKAATDIRLLLFSDPLGARTQDPNIKSVVLYLLS